MFSISFTVRIHLLSLSMNRTWNSAVLFYKHEPRKWSRECECTCVILIVHIVCIAYSLPLINKRQTWQQHPVVWLVFIKAKNNSNISSIIISLSTEFCRHLLGSVWQASCAWVCVCGSGIQGFLLKPPVWLSLPPNSTSSAKNSYSVAATRKTN